MRVKDRPLMIEELSCYLRRESRCKACLVCFYLQTAHIALATYGTTRDITLLARGISSAPSRVQISISYSVMRAWSLFL